jgi:hypothetical protein
MKGTDDEIPQVAAGEGRGYSRVLGGIGEMLKWMALMVLLSLLGCAPLRTLDDKDLLKPSSSSTSLKSVVDHVKNGLEDIERDADEVLDSAAVAENHLDPVYEKVNAEDRPAVDEALDSIKTIQSRTDTILEASERIHDEIALLDNLARQVDKMEDRLLALNSAVDTAKGKALEKLYGYITMFWVVGFSLIAAGLGVAFFLNKSYGGAISLLGAMMIGFASASQYYMEEIALIGAILLGTGMLGGIAALSWQFLKGRRCDDAMKEVVEMVEILRETMTEDERNRIFGPNGLASKVQSEFTKKLVSEIKQRNGFKTLNKLKQDQEEPGPGQQ